MPTPPTAVSTFAGEASPPSFPLPPSPGPVLPPGACSDLTLPAVLAAYGRTVHEAMPLIGGHQNQVWEVRCAGDRLVVRRCPPPAQGNHRLRPPGSQEWEHALLRRLADHGLPVPVPITAADGSSWRATADGATWTVFPFLPGRLHWQADPQRQDEAIDRLARSASRHGRRRVRPAAGHGRTAAHGRVDP